MISQALQTAADTLTSVYAHLALESTDEVDEELLIGSRVRGPVRARGALHVDPHFGERGSVVAQVVNHLGCLRRR
jgi:hypothetical protein